MTTYPEFLLSLLQMLASLAVVLGGLLLTLWFFKRFVQSRAGGVNNRLIRVLASSTIGLKKLAEGRSYSRLRGRKFSRCRLANKAV